jgi:alpha-1,3-rhamnosyl/mannosyltransferase
VIHALNPFIPLPTKRASVVTIHDILPVSHPHWFGRIHRTTFARVMRGLGRNQAQVICDSRYVADELVAEMGGRLDPDRVSVVHCGLDDRFRTPAPLDEVRRVCERYGLEQGRYLLALGVMSARESPDVIVEALRDVDPSLLGTPALVLTGPKRFGAEQVMAAVEKGGLAGRVLLAGFVPDDDLVPLIAGALALTHPSRDEGFGFTVLESMAVGTPVIASRAGSLPEVMGDGGALVPPEDPTAWAEAITHLATDPEERQRLVRAGAAQQATFSWGRAARETAAVYRTAIAG